MQPAQSSVTEAIAEQYLTGLKARDLEALLALFHDDILVFGRSGAITRRDDLRGLFVFAFDGFGDALKLLRVERRDIVGDSAFILWSIPGIAPLGVTSFEVVAGKIRRGTLVAHTEGLLARERHLGRVREHGEPERENG